MCAHVLVSPIVKCVFPLSHSEEEEEEGFFVSVCMCATSTEALECVENMSVIVSNCILLAILIVR